MAIFFTDHVRQRMTERGITEQHISGTIALPNRTQVANIGRVKVLQKEFQSRTLEVIVEAFGKHVRVITAYWL